MKINSILRTVCIVTAVAVLTAVVTAAAETVSRMSYCPDGYINVVALGAKANDGKDDTEAFQSAISSGMPVYVPAGEYIVSKPLTMNSQIIMGAGENKTFIRANLSDSEKAIFNMGSPFASIRDMTVGYADGIITGNEKSGERVAFHTGATWAFQRTASLRNVCFENVGTAILSLQGDESAMFSATIEDVSVKNFTYRGFQIEGEIRTGNYYRNIYMTTSYNADCALYFSGEESESTVMGVYLENMTVKEPIHMRGMFAFYASDFTMHNVSLNGEDSSYLFFDNSNGTIDLISIDGGNAGSRCSVISTGKGNYYVNNGKGSETSKVSINTLSVQKLNNGNLNDSDFAFFRSKNESGKYVFNISNYIAVEGSGDKAIYDACAVDGDNIVVKIGGGE